MNSLDPLKVLLVEDDEDDYVLTRGLFNEMKGPRLQIDWIANFDQGLSTMIENQHDVCLVDYRLGARNGVEPMRTTPQAVSFVSRGASLIRASGMCCFRNELFHCGPLLPFLPIG